MKTNYYYFFFLLIFSVIENPSFADNTWWAQTPSGHSILVSLNYQTYKCTVVAPANHTDAVDSWGNYAKPKGDLVIPNRIPYHFETEHGDTIIYYDIVEIGEYAFYGCDSLTSVTLPTNVKVIWNRAFMDCHQLTSITFGDSLYLISHYAFFRCTNLASINIPNTVYICGEHSFDSCINMTNAVVRSQIVNSDAFAHCYNLASLTLGDSVYILEVGSFSGNNLTEVTIPPSIQDMGYIISSSITTVNYNADSCYHGGFGGCSNLATLNIGDNVKMIPIGAFSSCPALTSVTIPKTVKIIEGGAFADDSNLTTVYFNADSCIQMASSQYEVGPVFDNCNNLTTVYVGNNVKTIPDHAFGGRQNISHVFLGDSVASIGNSSFSGCHSLQRIQFPSSVRRIGNSSFHQCRSFDTLYMGTNVSYIGSYSFSSSTNLTTVFCGDTVLDIGDHAFAYCPNLVLFKINTVTPPIIGNNCFDNVHSDFVIIVPRDSYNSYCISWNNYENNIHPDKCLLSVSTNGMGSTEGSGLYNYGDTIIVRAFDTGLCHFHYWSDGSTCDSMLIVLIRDTAITAFFEYDCDSIVNQLPYTANFTQCWTAEGGASIIDSNHASITSTGQKITSPWMQSVAGNTYLAWTQQREGDCNYETEQFVITIEDENGVVQSWTESAGNWGSSVNNFTSPGGPIRVSFEYIGSNIVPSFRISDVAIYSYFIEMEIESPAIAQIGDTVTLVAHASLQNGDSLDGKYWYMFDAARHYYSLPPYDDDTTVTIVSQTDNTLSLVWNSVGRYSVTINGYKNVFRGHNAYANASQDINIVNHSFYEEDSIYYTSETKDTVIGCHPQLHSANLPESVRVIKDSAFFSLDNLSSVSLPDGLEQIGKMAFAWNQGITEISLPRGLQYVGDNAFWWDTNLVVINFNADSCRVMSPSTASDGNYWPVFIGCDNVTTINIGENVTRIPDRAFSYCSKLRGTLVIPDAVTYIGTSAFFHWYENWEADNDTLQVVLGSGLTEIGDYAFGCPRSQLSSVISRAAVPPTIYEQTFYRYGPEYTPVLWVPCGSTQAYRTAQHWNRIEDIREDCDGVENPSEENNMKAYSISGNIVVTNAPDEIVTIYDMMGRVVLSSSITNENVHLPMPSAGVYMVKIGSLPAQKVVVMR